MFGLQGLRKHIFTQVGDDKPSTQCSLCRKHFSSQNQLENHFLSKKHQEQEVKEAERVKKEVEKRNEKNEEKGLEVCNVLMLINSCTVKPSL